MADMTAKQLKLLIVQTIHEAIDPDYGLELRPEVEQELLESIANAKQGKLIPVDDAAKESGLAWE
jgi:hypothetical protein